MTTTPPPPISTITTTAATPPAIVPTPLPTTLTTTSSRPSTHPTMSATSATQQPTATSSQSPTIVSTHATSTTVEEINGFRLSNIRVFPLKSCGAFEVQTWMIDELGLAYDRAWMIVNTMNACVTQKQVPKLCTIKPHIDLNTRKLTLSTPLLGGSTSITLPLDIDALETIAQAIPVTEGTRSKARVCNDRIDGIDCGDSVAVWLTKYLEFPCRLIRQNSNNVRSCRLLRSLTNNPNANTTRLSLANESQFLLTSQASMDMVNRYVQKCELAEQTTHDNESTPHNYQISASNHQKSDSNHQKATSPIPIDRFRGNLIVEGGKEFEEDMWATITIGRQQFDVVGPCQRCQMVCVDQQTGVRTKQPLIALSKFRRIKGATFFGQHLSHAPDKSTVPHVITIGDHITSVKI
eukprot:m.202057 g.202057  ORF g.202057 m.202057 type:complete len:408 (+) comp32814_c1_seq2:32-1255(+)